jgi:dihydrofolate reductase
VDFAGLFARVDTVLLGRRTYEVAQSYGGAPWAATTRVYVFSRTLRAEDHPAVTVVQHDAAEVVAALRHEAGSGEIWLFGGGELCAALLDSGQVDAVEVTVVPILLGAGIPLTAPLAGRTPLQLTHTQVYPSGMVALHYDVEHPAA